MRLNIVESKNAKQLYIIKSYRVNGKNTSKIMEKLGTYEELLKEHPDPIAWGKERAAELTRLEKEQQREITLSFSQNSLIPLGEKKSFQVGYLFLQSIYHRLGIPQICKQISKKYKFRYDLDEILSRLLYSRILYPSSKRSTFCLSKDFLEQPSFELNHIYRSLDVIAKESDFIQAEVYKNSKKYSKRKDSILYYDCTNYFFETEEEDGLRRYGLSKEHRPNPLVQMGLFMDAEGIPLAFSLSGGNTNEQTTLRPLEEQIIQDFGHSKFVVCTDAGLSSLANRKFNSLQNRSYITTQSLKKLKGHLKEWALATDGFRILGGGKKLYDLSVIEASGNREAFQDKVFYKQRWIKENGMEENLVVTFSFRYKEYQEQIRERQIDRAKKLMETPYKLHRKPQTDSKRLIQATSVTDSGEIAEQKIYDLDTKKIEKERRFDGFYGICTNLEEDAQTIAKISHNRWEIEECFRIMKSEFKARPVYLQKDERIKAHFTTCFLSLVLYRYLEKAIDEQATAPSLLSTLRNMKLLKVQGTNFIPAYERTELTNLLHERFGFRTDHEIYTQDQIKTILKNTKKIF